MLRDDGMIEVTFRNIELRRAKRPAGYLADLRAAATHWDESRGVAVFTPTDHAKLCAKYRPLDALPNVGGTTIAQPVPRDQWPTWAAAIHRAARLARRLKTDRGVGDTVEWIARRTGAKLTVAALKKMGMPDCGCAARRERYNQQYPYMSIYDGNAEK